MNVFAQIRGRGSRQQPAKDEPGSQTQKKEAAREIGKRSVGGQRSEHTTGLAKTTGRSSKPERRDGNGQTHLLVTTKSSRETKEKRNMRPLLTNKGKMPPEAKKRKNAANIHQISKNVGGDGPA